LHADYRSTGLSVDLHPIALIRRELDRLGVSRIEDMATHQGDRISVAGIVSNRQRPGTANGVVFMTLEDETGLGNLVIWPRFWQENRLLARNARLLGAEGRLQREGNAVSLLVDRFFEVPAPPEEARVALSELAVRSRDFH
jgi:DNA polymerase III alpha subunit